MNRLVSSYNRWSWGCLLRMTWWVVAAPWHQHPKRNGSNITCKVPHNAQGPFFFRRNDATGRRAFCFFLASDLRLGQWAREGDAIFVCGVHWSEHVNISRAIPSQSSWMRQIDGRLGRGPYLFFFFFFLPSPIPFLLRLIPSVPSLVLSWLINLRSDVSALVKARLSSGTFIAFQEGFLGLSGPGRWPIRTEGNSVLCFVFFLFSFFGGCSSQSCCYVF